MLPPDTVPVVRHTSRADYCTGDLKLGRIAVLADLRRYLHVPFDCLVKCVGTMPSQQDLHRIRNNLTESKILTDNENGLRWTDFTPPAASKGSEENVFRPLGHIITEILAQVPNRGVSFPNGTPLSQRNNTSRPDGYLVLSNKKTEPKTHWFDITVPFEFKKDRDIESLRDDEHKIIWSLHSIMHEDLLCRFAFGITIEDTQLRLWLSNRAFLAVTEPINFENIDDVISLFYALGSASASSTTSMKGLGWDPTVERIRDGKDFQSKFTIGDEVFTTTCELATYGADSMVERGQLGSIARNDTGIPHRVHTRIVFQDVGVAINDVTSLADNLSCLSGALKALYYMHKAGWVHRDFSIGNIIWVGGIGKLCDFDYAEKIDPNTSHDVRTGTMHFMALEVEKQGYHFYSDPDSFLLDTELPPKPPFRMNFLHDIESVWWAFAWIFFYHTETTANTGHSFDAQWRQFQLAFPVTAGRVSRWYFFERYGDFHWSCQTVLSKTCLDVCWNIPHFAKALQDGYRMAEADYPLLALDDTLLEDIHRRAAEFLRDAQERAGAIKLCPLPNLLKQKRHRPGDETSPPPENQGKKPRHD